MNTDPLRMFGYKVGLALSSTKVPEGIDPNDLTDEQMLEATATLLDRLDDATDEYIGKLSGDHKVERTMQADLRRIAATLARRS